MTQASEPTGFRARLLSGSVLTGLFVKHAFAPWVEVLASSAFDVLVFDTEHSAFSRHSLDACLLAAIASRKACLVRVPDASGAHIQQAIAMGADGIMIPHINSLQTAREAVEFARTVAIERAVAGFGRSAKYGAEPWLVTLARLQRELCVILQVDEPPGVALADEIAQIPGVDALFIGRLGLTLRLGALNSETHAVKAAMQAVADACSKSSRRLGLFLTEPEQASEWQKRGANLFVIGTDLELAASAAAVRVASFQTRLVRQI